MTSTPRNITGPQDLQGPKDPQEPHSTDLLIQLTRSRTLLGQLVVTNLGHLLVLIDPLLPDPHLLDPHPQSLTSATNQFTSLALLNLIITDQLRTRWIFILGTTLILSTTQNRTR